MIAVPRPEEDQPNCELPAPTHLPPTSQHWRVEVPTPATTLLLGQRVPKSDHEDAFGYPGVSVATRASFFANVAERTLWQGHETIAFQSLWNTELHSGNSVVIGATNWTEQEAEGSAGELLGVSKAQAYLYKQLRDQSLGWNAATLFTNTLSIVKSLVNYPLLSTGTPVAFFGLAKGLVSEGHKIYKEVELTKQTEPGPGVFITSNLGVSIAANTTASLYAGATFDIVAGATVGTHGMLKASHSGGLSIDVYGGLTASIGAAKSVDVTGLLDVNVTAKLGTAKLRGKKVVIGSQTPGSELFKGKVGVTPFFARPTQSVKIEALKEISSNVVGKFVINAPVGEVSSESRKTQLSALESMTLKTPIGEIVISATGITLKHVVGNVVKIDAGGVEVNGMTGAQVKVDAVGGVSLRSLGGSVRMDPGGIISVTGVLIKLG